MDSIGLWQPAFDGLAAKATTIFVSYDCQSGPRSSVKRKGAIWRRGGRPLPGSSFTIFGSKGCRAPVRTSMPPIERCGRPIRPEEYHAEARGTSRIFRNIDDGESIGPRRGGLGGGLLSLAMLPAILPPLLSEILW